MAAPDLRRDQTDPPPAAEGEAEYRPKSTEEVLRNVDGRSMEMFHRLGKLAQEVAKVTAGLVVNTAQIRDFDERLKKQEQAVDERLKKQEQASKHVRSDIRAIREALEGRKVAEDYKDFVDDVEDSKRFILKAKQRERNIKRIVWLMIGGAATALGTFGAGAAWQSCTHTAGVADVHLRHEAEK